MDFSRLGDTNTSSDNHVEQLHHNNLNGCTATITDESCITADKDSYHQTPQTPQQPLNYKRLLSCNDDDELQVPRKKFKVDEACYRIAIVIPMMANRFRHIIATYSRWRNNGFDIVLVFNKDEEGEITKILQQHADTMTSFVMYPYITSIPPNAGIAKNEAYRILQQYLDLPNFKFALLLDDTVDDITSTSGGKSIMTDPYEFYHAVIRFAEESPIFGGTVAANRHPDTCKQEGTVTVDGGFLQQTLIFSCRGTPTLTKHFQDIDDYVIKMRRLSYRNVPFGEDVSFQIALYEHGLLPKQKSVQFWGLGITRIKHISATKQQFDQLDYAAKEALKDMLIYLQEQGALTTNPHTNELSGVKVIPGHRIRIPIRGRKGERPWREAFRYTFPCSKENNKDLINKLHP